MRASSHIGAGGLALALAGAYFAVSACSGGNAEIGEPCSASDDCDDELQCLGRMCTPLCNTHVDCGDGYRCEVGGECALVTSAIGERCLREIDCGLAQTCEIDARDGDGDGKLNGTCQLQLPGLTIASECDRDDDCQSGLCSLGRCAQLCTQLSDCPPGMACASVPRLLPDSAPRFSACMPGRGVISNDIKLRSPSTVVRVPVPSHAQSFALIAEVDEEDQLVGASRVVAPDGSLLYREPTTSEAFYANPIRYQPGRGVSTLLVSNTTSVDLDVGVYQVTVSSQLEAGGPGTAVPRLRVLYKIDTSATLDLHFAFLDLADHPCAEAFDVGRLDAAAAQQSQAFRDYLAQVSEVFASAGVHLGEVTYRDITDRDDLDGIEQDRAGDLFSLATEETGVTVFFVRSIAPAGVQAVVGGTPGPPLTAGSRGSGVAIGADTLCYRDWPALSRITAHAIARQMGLYYNRAPDGNPDTIEDSDELPANLLFFSDQGGVELSEGQRKVLRRYPGLR